MLFARLDDERDGTSSDWTHLEVLQGREWRQSRAGMDLASCAPAAPGCREPRHAPPLGAKVP